MAKPVSASPASPSSPTAPAWRSYAYGLFGVPDRTLRRWVDGKSEIPRGVGRQLLRELDIRRGELNEIRDRIAWERR